MKTSFLSLFLLYGVHSLEAPLDGEDEGVTALIIITISIITSAIIVSMYICTYVEVHSQEDGHKKYDLNFNLGSGKQLQEVSLAQFVDDK